MHTTLKMLIMVCPLIFTAGFVDSIAGGGGLISLPAYLFAGLPIHFAYGTNKFSSTFGTFFSTLRFIKNKQINYKSAAASVSTALIGSYLGAKLAMALDEKYLRYSLAVLLPVVGVFILTRKGFGETDNSLLLSSAKILSMSLAAGLLVGIYDGFFGPGTGTFLILIYTQVIGFNIITASGNAKLVNLASNISALTAFIIGGKVYFAIGVPAAVFGILGNWIGAGLAVKKGAKIIKPVLLLVLGILFLKIAFDIIKQEF